MKLHLKLYLNVDHNLQKRFFSLNAINARQTSSVVVIVSFQKRAKAQLLLDKVFEHLELIEKDYFGLEFSDSTPDDPHGVVSFIYLSVN